jgi:hypothetical protein
VDLDALCVIINAIAEDSARARCRTDHAQQHLDGGAFAGTVAAQKAGNPLGADAEIEVIDCAEAAVILGELAGVNDALGNHDFL